MREADALGFPEELFTVRLCCGNMDVSCIDRGRTGIANAYPTAKVAGH